MKKIKFRRFSAKATAPKIATLISAGYDLFSVEKVTIIVSTDIGMKSHRKLVGKIGSRSSLLATSIDILAGVVDSSTRVIICVVLHNLLTE